MANLTVGKQFDYSVGVRHGLPLVLAFGGLALIPVSTDAIAQGTPPPVFRSSVERVTLAVTVRTARGRHVTNLQAKDFTVIDDGVARPITEFRTDAAPISLGFLADFSGSMDVAARRGVARENVRHMLAWMQPGVDRAALYMFDQMFRELQPLAPAPGDILAQFDRLDRPFGVTSLFDAIAEAGRRIAKDGGPRRAVVALTDGADNASSLTPSQVSTIASGIDVPVYMIVVVSPFDRSGRTTVDDARIVDGVMQGPLADLARWTGGEIYTAVGPAQISQAAQQVVTDLRQQYLIAFEPGTRPGWHPLQVQTRDDELVVRVRSGYYVRDGSNGL
jgi:VWFA-related protein